MTENEQNELAAWRTRFPDYCYRPQDDCVSLRLERFGCHCDLDPGTEPDQCVFDNGDIVDCVNAQKLSADGKGKTACQYWKKY